jgi:hypothetical protein
LIWLHFGRFFSNASGHPASGLLGVKERFFLFKKTHFLLPSISAPTHLRRQAVQETDVALGFTHARSLAAGLGLLLVAPAHNLFHIAGPF